MRTRRSPRPAKAVEDARGILAGLGGRARAGVVTYNGRMIENLHVDTAQRTLAMHDAIEALAAYGATDRTPAARRSERSHAAGARAPAANPPATVQTLRAEREGLYPAGGFAEVGGGAASRVRGRAGPQAGVPRERRLAGWSC